VLVRDGRPLLVATKAQHEHQEYGALQ